MGLQITILVLLIFAYSLFTAIKTAFSQVNKSDIKNLASDGKKSAIRTTKMLGKENRTRSTLSILKVSTFAGAISLATSLFLDFSPEYGIWLSLGYMTAIFLIFGEILSRSFADENPLKVTLFASYFMTPLIIVLFPISIMLNGIKKGLSKVFHFENRNILTEDELLTFVDEAEQDGSINENEGALIRNVIEFDDEIIENILTPRINIVAVSIKENTQNIQIVFRKSGYSRLPVYDETIDTVIGILNHKDFYNYVLLGNESIKNIISKPVNVTINMKIIDLMNVFRKTKSQMAIVKDEFDGTVGLVTLEDILEEIVGDIWDEHDEIVEQIVMLDENTYKVKGLANLDDLFERIGIEEDVDSVTVNGWVLEELGEIPRPGDSFVKSGLEVIIEAASETSVLEAIVKVLSDTDLDK